MIIARNVTAEAASPRRLDQRLYSGAIAALWAQWGASHPKGRRFEAVDQLKGAIHELAAALAILEAEEATAGAPQLADWDRPGLGGMGRAALDESHHLFAACGSLIAAQAEIAAGPKGSVSHLLKRLEEAEQSVLCAQEGLQPLARRKDGRIGTGLAAPAPMWNSPAHPTAAA